MRVFVYRTFKLFLDTGEVSDHKRSAQYCVVSMPQVIKAVRSRINQNSVQTQRNHGLGIWYRAENHESHYQTRLGAIKRQRGQCLTVALKENRKKKLRCLLSLYGNTINYWTSMILKIWIFRLHTRYCFFFRCKSVNVYGSDAGRSDETCQIQSEIQSVSVQLSGSFNVLHLIMHGTHIIRWHLQDQFKPVQTLTVRVVNNFVLWAWCLWSNFDKSSRRFASICMQHLQEWSFRHSSTLR